MDGDSLFFGFGCIPKRAMNPLHVYDYEDLYRSVRPDEYKTIGGKVIISASAFNDRERKPSVDRAWIGRDFKEIRKSPSDGITKLTAGEVRTNSSVEAFDAKGRKIGRHTVDAMHRPIIDCPGEPENPAHCQIECDPRIETDNTFKRLKEALAGLATRVGFIVRPDSA
jgi:hypothetical protein